MIIEIHIQVLAPSYGSPVAIHFYYKRVDVYITVFDTDVDRDTVDQISLFVLEEKFFDISAKVSPSRRTRLSPSTWIADRNEGIFILRHESKSDSADTLKSTVP